MESRFIKNHIEAFLQICYTQPNRVLWGYGIMCKISFEKIIIPVAKQNGESSLPQISKMINVQQRREAILDEDDELYIGYGFVKAHFRIGRKICTNVN